MKKSESVFIPDTEVAQRFSVSRATVWRWAQGGGFPKPVKFSNGCTRWRIADLESWESRQEGAA